MEIESIINSVKSYDPNVNWNQILKAYEFSKKLHSRQIRASGDPYLEHPIQVAKLLTADFATSNPSRIRSETFEPSLSRIRDVVVVSIKDRTSGVTPTFGLKKRGGTKKH